MAEIKLTKNTKKILIRKEGDTYKVAVGDECCEKFFFIAIWNSNCVIDDNFSIKVNDQEIGTINNNSNTCTGRIFAEDTDITIDTILNVNTLLPCCANRNFEPTIEIDSKNAPFQNGNNELTIESIQDNGANNFGGVFIGYLVKAGDSYRLCGPNLAIPNFYNHLSGVGEFSIVNFTLP